MQRLIFLESNTTGSGMLALSAASRLGLEPVLLTNDSSRYHQLAETPARVIDCDTNSYQSVREAVLALGADTVAGITTTSEFYLAFTAQLAAEHGLSGADPQAVAACRDKAATRELLAAAGIGQPGYVVVRDVADIEAALARVGLPCVLKPADDTGSNNVMICRSASAAVAHAAQILSVSVNVRGQAGAAVVLVEEYLDGPEVSVEMFGHNGRNECIGIVEKSVRNEPHFVEDRHVYPAELDPGSNERVVEAVRGALDAVGMTHGPTHTEVKILPDRVAVIEINARLAGGMIPTLVRLVDGVDLLEQQLRCALGREPRLGAVRKGFSGIQFLTVPHAGELLGVTGVERARALAGVTDLVITATAGRQVRPARNAYDRLGYVIAVGASRSAVHDRLDAAAAAVKFQVGGDASYTRLTNAAGMTGRHSRGAIR